MVSFFVHSSLFKEFLQTSLVASCTYIRLFMMHKALRLYRHILQQHRALPPQMRKLGNEYVKSEFSLHKSVTKEIQLKKFYDAWENYLYVLRKKSNDVKGKHLNEKERATMSEDQKAKLEQLRQEVKTSIGI